MRKADMREHMMNIMYVNSLIKDSEELRNHILFEPVPSGEKFLAHIIEALRDKYAIQITHQSFGRPENTYIVEPYCLKMFKQRWYMLTKVKQQFRTFSLDRIKSLKLSELSFLLEKDFDAEEFFHDYFGVFRDELTPPQEVIIRASIVERPYLRDLPLHHSQKEIVTTDEYSDFSYFISPTDDFIGEILRKKDRLYVISPIELREKTLKIIKEMGKNYKK